MDLSKLPKLSSTPPPPPLQAGDPDASAAAPAYAPPPHYAAGPAVRGPGLGADVWLSAIFGLIFMLIGRNFAAWAIAALTGQPFKTNVTWTTGANAGQDVAYWDLQGFTAWSDAGMFAFGLALVVDAVALAAVGLGWRGRTAIAWLGLALSVVATALNAYVAAKLFSIGALPLMSLLAVAFGGYTAMQQWRVVQAGQAPAGRA